MKFKKNGIAVSMENEGKVSIISAPNDHGFRNFTEARRWAKENIVGSVQQSEIGKVNISGTAVDKYLSQKAVVGETHEDKKGDEHIKDIVLVYGAIDIEGKSIVLKQPSNDIMIQLLKRKLIAMK